MLSDRRAHSAHEPYRSDLTFLKSDGPVRQGLAAKLELRHHGPGRALGGGPTAKLRLCNR